MSRTVQLGLLILLVTMSLTSGMEISRRQGRSVYEDPNLTAYDDDCPNGLIAYQKFNRSNGVFDCAIKTAEICFALCEIMDSSNWDVSNTLNLRDQTDRDKWYCRAMPGYPTRPCFFKPKQEIEADVARMYEPEWR